MTTIAVTTKEPHAAVVEECVRMDARAIVRPGQGGQAQVSLSLF